MSLRRSPAFFVQFYRDLFGHQSRWRSLFTTRTVLFQTTKRKFFGTSPRLMSSADEYSTWTNEKLIERVTALEAQLRKQQASVSTSQITNTSISNPIGNARQFDPTKYASRKIALKLAYLGQRYNGFEYHANNATPLPTIEEELWKALTKTKLIFPKSAEEYSWEGCDYSKCGRTDKGVSAFGQVIGLLVRSARPKAEEGSETCGKDFDDIEDELPYARILNRVLPDDIRILAWCPAPTADFSARFSCKERQYRYFFTQPAFHPIPGPDGHLKRSNGKGYRDGWLDIQAMQEAAKLFVGLHDFRNFCKVDPARQITNFERRIFFADIEEYRFFDEQSNFDIFGASQCAEIGNGQAPRVYCFTVHGSAFLWHQIRHMVALIFLVGQGLEAPCIISDLLDSSRIPEKPMYEMATDAPLVLWNCVFPSENGDQRKDTLKWIYTDTASEVEGYNRALSGNASGTFGAGNIREILWSGWRRRKIDEILAGSLLESVMKRQSVNHGKDPDDTHQGRAAKRPVSERVFDGGNSPRLKGQYVPVLELKRIERPEIVNARYLARNPQISSG